MQQLHRQSHSIVSICHTTPTHGTRASTRGGAPTQVGTWTAVKRDSGPAFRLFPIDVLTQDVDGKTALELYALIVDDGPFDLMAVETNRYAEQVIAAAEISRRSRLLRAWVPTSAKEMKVFLGVLLLMGLVHMPKVENYWSRRGDLYGVQAIKEAMKRDRFLLLFRFWPFADNEAQRH